MKRKFTALVEGGIGQEKQSGLMQAGEEWSPDVELSRGGMFLTKAGSHLPMK